MADILETVKALIRQGASESEIVETLKTMGLSGDDARKLILLAHKDMLRVLRNEIRSIASDAFVEQYEKMKKEINVELNHIVDVQVKLLQKSLQDLLRKEINRYASSVSRIEDKITLLERKVYDLEDRVARLEVVRPHRGNTRFIRFILPLLGIVSLALAIFFLKDTSALFAFGIGVLLVLGGVLFG